MSSITFLDLIALLACLSGIIVLSLNRKSAVLKDIRLLLLGLLMVTAVYFSFLFVEWLGITHTLDSLEDMIGAMMPIMWGFLLYSFVQQKARCVSTKNLHYLHSIGDAVATDI
jgi:hypothetical protein